MFFMSLQFLFVENPVAAEKLTKVNDTWLEAPNMNSFLNDKCPIFNVIEFFCYLEFK